MYFAVSGTVGGEGAGYKAEGFMSSGFETGGDIR